MVLLSIGIVPQLYALYNSPNPFTTISSFCKARSYLNQTSAMSCRWLLVMACVDRCFSCSTNARIRRYSSVIIARRIAILLIVIWFILPIHVLIFMDIQLPGNIACLIVNTDVALYHRFYTIIMGSALPSVITFICSLFIWRNFQQTRRRRAVITSVGVVRRKKIREQQISFMLLSQVAIFIISSMPFMSFNIYDTMTRLVTNKSADRKAIEGFFKTFTELLIYLIAMSFYSNTLVSPTFRKELITLFKLIVTYGRQPSRRRINPSNVNVLRSNPLKLMTQTRTIRTAMPEVG
jgi:hypothetical protein